MTFNLDKLKPTTLAAITLALQNVVDLTDDPIEGLYVGQMVQAVLNAGINNCGEDQFMDYLENV